MSATDLVTLAPYVLLVLFLLIPSMRNRTASPAAEDPGAIARDNAAIAAANTALIENTGSVVDMVMGTANALRAEVSELRDRMEKFELRERVQRRWIAMLSDQVVDAGGKPVTYEQAARAAGVRLSAIETSYTDLRTALVGAFSIAELNQLAMDAGILPDDIPGDTISERAGELVAIANRRRIMSKLQATIRQARPQFPGEVLDLLP